jgi:maltoporin
VSFAPFEHFKVLGEAGYDRIEKTNGLAEAQQLLKLTGAVAFAGGRGFWGRPEIRVFFTQAIWSAAARGAGIDSYDLYKYGDKLSGWTFGFQGEAIF